LGLTADVTGHFFVLRGDLNQLKCDAILVPCDGAWNVVWDHWSALLQEHEFDQDDYGLARPRGEGESGRFRDMSPDRGRAIRLVVTAFGGSGHRWVADGVVDAIAALAKDLVVQTGRVKPLIALPLVGTGFGGLEHRRGELIKALLPALDKVAHQTDTDVALVLFNDRDHAAVQSQRSHSYWEGFDTEQLKLADDLGRKAAHKELSLFLGSGVSVPLGLPDWRGLLSEVGGEQLEQFSPAQAPEIAQRIARNLGGVEFYQKVAARLTTTGVAPAHLPLAGLGVRQAVTTNYDTAYEAALATRLGADGFQVLTRELAAQPKPWLLKIHGDVADPKTIVITSDDYTVLKEQRGALHAVVEALLMTSHLLFVGYSMGDPDFVESANRVRDVRGLASHDADNDFATILALHPGAVSAHPDFQTVPMLDGRDDTTAARLLEIFLDRLSWAASKHGEGSHSYLLDPNYGDLLAEDPDNTRLRDLLAELVTLPVDDPARRSTGWKFVQDLITELGGPTPGVPS